MQTQHSSTESIDLNNKSVNEIDLQEPNFQSIEVDHRSVKEQIN